MVVSSWSVVVDQLTDATMLPAVASE